MKTFYLICILSFFVITTPVSVPSCNSLVDTAVAIATEDSGNTPLKNSEVIEGLKTALKIGTDSSVVNCSAPDGFYRDQTIKILLPPEAAVIYENKDKALVRALGIDEKIDEAILALNRAAENASKEAGPIFRNAVQGMSINDGFSILKGKNPLSGEETNAFDSTAATQYLKAKTMEDLTQAFAPVVSQSLDKKLIGDFSPSELWSSLSEGYNGVARNSFGRLKPMETTNLEAYVTQKTLEGLFMKIAEEEKKIRNNPLNWAKTSAGNILKRVFG